MTKVKKNLCKATFKKKMCLLSILYCCVFHNHHYKKGLQLVNNIEKVFSVQIIRKTLTFAQGMQNKLVSIATFFKMPNKISYFPQKDLNRTTVNTRLIYLLVIPYSTND